MRQKLRNPSSHGSGNNIAWKDRLSTYSRRFTKPACNFTNQTLGNASKNAEIDIEWPENYQAVNYQYQCRSAHLPADWKRLLSTITEPEIWKRMTDETIFLRNCNKRRFNTFPGIAKKASFFTGDQKWILCQHQAQEPVEPGLFCQNQSAAGPDKKPGLHPKVLLNVWWDSGTSESL